MEPWTSLMALSRPRTWCGFSGSTFPSGLVWRAATQLALWAMMIIWARMQQHTPQPCPISAPLAAPARCFLAVVLKKLKPVFRDTKCFIDMGLLPFFMQHLDRGSCRCPGVWGAVQGVPTKSWGSSLHGKGAVGDRRGCRLQERVVVGLSPHWGYRCYHKI